MSESEGLPPTVEHWSEAAGQGREAAADDDFPGTVLEALGDAACRVILREVNDSMTAKEIAEATGLPLSSTYRKLAVLSDTRLLKERMELRTDGNHTRLYVPDFEAVRIVVDRRRNIDVAITGSSDPSDG